MRKYLIFLVLLMLVSCSQSTSSTSSTAPTVIPTSTPTKLVEAPKNKVETFKLDLSYLNVGHQAALFEAKYDSRDLQPASGGVGQFGPNALGAYYTFGPGSELTRGLWLIIYKEGKPHLRVPAVKPYKETASKYVAGANYRLLIVTPFIGEQDIGEQMVERLLNLPKTTIDGITVYDIGKIRLDSSLTNAYSFIRPNFDKLSSEKYRTLNKATGWLEPDLVKAVDKNISSEVIEYNWGISPQIFEYANVINKLRKLGIIDDKDTIATDKVAEALKSGAIDENLLYKLSIPQEFIDKAKSY